MQYYDWKAAFERNTDKLPLYEDGITKDAVDDIRFILDSLANKTFSQLLSIRVQLLEALESIEEVHPLHFISTAFQDSEMTENLHRIKDKEWLWRHFFGKIKQLLNQEVEVDNMQPESVQLFAEQLGLETNEIIEYAMQADWDTLVDSLFERFPVEKSC